MLKIKFTIIIVFLFISSCKGQKTIPKKFTYNNFEIEVLKYTPIQREGVSEENYNRAKLILERTSIAVKGKVENFVVTDYWNIANAFAKLNEPKEYIELAFQKGIDKDSKSMCEYIAKISKIPNTIIELFKEKIPEIFYSFSSSCDYSNFNKINIDKYATDNGYDLELVKLLDRILYKDQLYRNQKDLSKQNTLDIQNQKSIDSLFNIYKEYVGKSLVGKRYETVMWIVVQHSNIKKMKDYLPTIHRAYINNEITKAPLLMLIDRIYSIEFNYQIFGSQGGIDIADEKIINKIKKEYKIE